MDKKNKPILNSDEVNKLRQQKIRGTDLSLFTDSQHLSTVLGISGVSAMRLFAKLDELLGRTSVPKPVLVGAFMRCPFHCSPSLSVDCGLLGRLI